jgi:hypothetical protein
LSSLLCFWRADSKRVPDDVRPFGCDTAKSHRNQTRATGEANPMTKQIKIYGHHFKLYSLDKGHTWSSSPRSIVAYGRRKQMLSLELRKRFELMDKLQDADPDNFN